MFAKRDMRMIQERLQRPDFESLFWELAGLRMIKYSDAPITISSLTAGALSKGRPPRVYVAEVRGVPFVVTQARAHDLLLEAAALAHRLAGYFPMAVRWRWEYLSLQMALRGVPIVHGERCGGPQPTPEAEKRKIVANWRKVAGRQTKAVFAATHGIDERTLRRWEHEFPDP